MKKYKYIILVFVVFIITIGAGVISTNAALTLDALNITSNGVLNLNSASNSNVNIGTSTDPVLFIDTNFKGVGIGASPSVFGVVQHRPILDVVSGTANHLFIAGENNFRGETIEMWASGVAGENLGRTFRWNSSINGSGDGKGSLEGFYGDEDAIYGGAGFYWSTKQGERSIAIVGDGYNSVNGTNLIVDDFRQTIRTMFANDGIASSLWLSDGSVGLGGAIDVSDGNTDFTGAAMIIKGDGNVGIGTTTPTSKLQVVGLSEYADNVAALTDGLTVGAFYRTGDIVKVVH